MFPVRSIVRALPQARLAIQSRNMTAISGPPQNRIGFTEKVAHGLVMSAFYMVIPTWVLLHIREYRGIAK